MGAISAFARTRVEGGGAFARRRFVPPKQDSARRPRAPSRSPSRTASSEYRRALARVSWSARSKPSSAGRRAQPCFDAEGTCAGTRASRGTSMRVLAATRCRRRHGSARRRPLVSVGSNCTVRSVHRGPGADAELVVRGDRRGSGPHDSSRARSTFDGTRSRRGVDCRRGDRASTTDARR